MLDAWQHGGKVDGKPVDDKRLLAYLEKRRDSYDKDDPEWDEWNNEAFQMRFRISNEGVMQRYESGAISASAVGAHYREWAKKMPKNSSYYRNLMQSAGQFARAAAVGRASADTSRYEENLQKRLDTNSKPIKIWDDLMGAFGMWAMSQGWLNEGMSITDMGPLSQDRFHSWMLSEEGMSDEQRRNINKEFPQMRGKAFTGEGIETIYAAAMDAYDGNARILKKANGPRKAELRANRDKRKKTNGQHDHFTERFPAMADYWKENDVWRDDYEYAVRLGSGNIQAMARANDAYIEVLEGQRRTAIADGNTYLERVIGQEIEARKGNVEAVRAAEEEQGETLVNGQSLVDLATDSAGMNVGVDLLSKGQGTVVKWGGDDVAPDLSADATILESSPHSLYGEQGQLGDHPSKKSWGIVKHQYDAVTKELLPAVAGDWEGLWKSLGTEDDATGQIEFSTQKAERIYAFDENDKPYPIADRVTTADGEHLTEIRNPDGKSFVTSDDPFGSVGYQGGNQRVPGNDQLQLVRTVDGQSPMGSDAIYLTTSTHHGGDPGLRFPIVDDFLDEEWEDYLNSSGVTGAVPGYGSLYMNQDHENTYVDRWGNEVQIGADGLAIPGSGSDDRGNPLPEGSVVDRGIFDKGPVQIMVPKGMSDDKVKKFEDLILAYNQGHWDKDESEQRTRDLEGFIRENPGTFPFGDQSKEPLYWTGGSFRDQLKKFFGGKLLDGIPDPEYYHLMREQNEADDPEAFIDGELKSSSIETKDEQWKRLQKKLWEKYGIPIAYRVNGWGIKETEDFLEKVDDEVDKTVGQHTNSAESLKAFEEYGIRIPELAGTDVTSDPVEHLRKTLANRMMAQAWEDAGATAFSGETPEWLIQNSGKGGFVGVDGFVDTSSSEYGGVNVDQAKARGITGIDVNLGAYVPMTLADEQKLHEILFAQLDHIKYMDKNGLQPFSVDDMGSKLAWVAAHLVQSAEPGQTIDLEEIARLVAAAEGNVSGVSEEELNAFGSAFERRAWDRDLLERSRGGGYANISEVGWRSGEEKSNALFMQESSDRYAPGVGFPDSMKAEAIDDTRDMFRIDDEKAKEILRPSSPVEAIDDMPLEVFSEPGGLPDAASVGPRIPFRPPEETSLPHLLKISPVNGPQTFSAPTATEKPATRWKSPQAPYPTAGPAPARPAPATVKTAAAYKAEGYDPGALYSGGKSAPPPAGWRRWS